MNQPSKNEKLVSEESVNISQALALAPFTIRPMIPNEVYQVGCIDWKARVFHSFHTEHGATYNSYLVRLTDGETHQPFAVVIDGVKECYNDLHYSKIKGCLKHLGILEDGPRYLISHHSEGDHSGSIPYLCEKFKSMKIVANKLCMKNLKQMYPEGLRNTEFVDYSDNPIFIPCKNVENVEFHLVQTSLLHWEDSSMSFCPQKKILFSNDAFGAHVSSSGLWREDYEVEGRETWMRFIDYIANILAPFSNQMGMALNKLAPLLKSNSIQYIMTAHGFCYRNTDNDIEKAVAAYKLLAEKKSHLQQPTITIIYDSMYGQTEKAATVVAETIMHSYPNVAVNLCDAKVTHISTIATYVWFSAGIVFASPTMNSSPLPTVAGIIVYLRGLKLLEGRVVALTGGYNWDARAIIEMADMLKHGLAKCRFVEPPELAQIKFRIHCDPETVVLLAKMAEKLAQTVLEMCYKAK